MVKAGKTTQSVTKAADSGDAAGTISSGPSAASSRGADDIVAQVHAALQTPPESKQSASTQIKTLTPLWQINFNTAKLAEWDVMVHDARLEEYEYPWEGKQKKAIDVSRTVVQFVMDGPAGKNMVPYKMLSAEPLENVMKVRSHSCLGGICFS